DTAEFVVVVLTTAPNLGDAEHIARGLVELRHAACVNVVPGVRSFYRWQGSIEEDQEVQLVIKTTRACIEPLQAWLEENHPYDVPEFVMLSADGSDDYLRFVREATAPER
ncbi:MAG: periplasmic divalent cation tolerance protein, partial [Polyangiales bacterium]